MQSVPSRWRFSPHRLTRRQVVVIGAIACAIAGLTPLAASPAMVQLGWPGWLTLGTVGLAFLLNALTQLPADIVFLWALSLLFITGVLDAQQALSGFSNSGLVTVGVLYLVVAGLQQTGALGWISQQVLGRPQSQSAALVRLMLPIMGLSAFLNNTPVVAMFIPVVNDWCRKLRISPSKLMMPLSFAAIFGGVCTLIGTSTNLVVNGLLIDGTDHPGLKLFDLAWVGLPCAIVGFMFLYVTQRWLLPERKPVMGDRDDVRQYTVEMVVPPRSPLAGKTVEQAGLRHLPGLYLIEVARGDQVIAAVSPRETLREQDQLVFVGVVDSILDLQRLRGLQPATDQVFKLDTPRTERCLIEAVVSNTCPLVGRTIREGQFRSLYNAVVLAVARNGDRLLGKVGDIRLQAGDTLLLEANSAFVEQQRISRDFYLVSSLPDSEPLRHEKAPIALVTLIVMVVLAGVGWLSMLKAAVLAAMVMLSTGCCAPVRAMRSVEWSVLLVIGAALGLSTAMESTGAAAAIAGTFIQAAGDNPLLALAVVYGITTLLTEIITNNAAAALMFPISLSLAQNLGVSYLPFTIAIMVAASASFATPIGYQTNLMVYGPGGYKFTDFMRIGIPLNLLFWVMTVAIAPLAFPF
ncbi:MAG: anion permease [Leptolyngbyaceae cyanobacterium T60_A2020_046]|nr:anion permease [Leptolyngbyaceae cyanobacterium T60_A2020_046]